MKLKTRYERLKQENEYWSDTNCLAVALTEGEEYSKGEVARVFKMCDKSDYLKCDRGEVLDSLYRLNNENMSL